ncbi:sterile alpha motif domain-containing protein 9-like [Amphiura filiformis]|uniref:sterile alpha motif domain-containing protein 9-like n=1 Tax=Amphiura filiformis TaxID=82378 RepID=UPI003B2265D0
MDPDGRYRDRPAKTLKEWDEWKEEDRFVYNHSKVVLVTKKCRIKARGKHRDFRTSLLTRLDASKQEREEKPTTKYKRRPYQINTLPTKQTRDLKTIQVFVKTPLNSTITLRYPLRTPIEDIHDRVSEEINLPKDNFELVGLNDFKLCRLLTLEDHGLKHDDNIHVKLVNGLRGGADRPDEKDSQTADQQNVSKKLDRDNVEYGEVIGQGGFGTVYSVTFKESVQGFTAAAAKVIPKLRQEEVDILGNVDHQHIVKLIGSYKDGPVNILFFELSPLGSLEVYLKDKSKSLPLSLVKKWLTESALALQYLHDDMDIIHRDIKPSNCLLFDEERKILKLSDFGLARELDRSHTYSTQKGTFRYMAPEIHKDNKFSRYTDIYAYGMLTLHIFSRTEPFPGLEWVNVVYRVCTDNLKPSIPQNCPQELAELINQCISTNPADRPNVASIVSSLVSTGFLRDLPTQMNEWNKDDVKQWLHQIGIPETTASRLHEENVDGEVLAQYSANELISDFGGERGFLKKGDARKIMNRAKALNHSRAFIPPPSEECLETREEPTFPEAAITNSASHEIKPGRKQQAVSAKRCQQRTPIVTATTSNRPTNPIATAGEDGVKVEKNETVQKKFPAKSNEPNDNPKERELAKQFPGTARPVSTGEVHFKQKSSNTNEISTSAGDYPGGARPKQRQKYSQIPNPDINSTTHAGNSQRQRQDLDSANQITRERNQSEHDYEKQLRTLLLGDDQQLFDKGHYPILVVNKPSASFLDGSNEEKDKQMRFVRDIDWTLVLDLYHNSKSDGLCQYFEKDKCAILQLPETLTEDECNDEMDIPDIPFWMFCNGRTDDKNLDEHKPMSIQNWNQNRSHAVEGVISKYSGLISSQRAVIVFLILSDDDIDIQGEIFRKFTSAFQGLENITCIVENAEVYTKWVEEVKRSCSREDLDQRSCVGDSMNHVNNVIRKMANVDEIGPYHILVDSTRKCTLPERARDKWTNIFVLCSNQCENTSKKEDDYDFEDFRKTTELAFYRGGTVDWWNFRLSEAEYNGGKGFNHVLKRSSHESLRRKVQDAMDRFHHVSHSQCPIVTFTISHQPGAGGTTMCRHILWDFHRKYRCLIVNKVTEDTTKQILEIYHYGYSENQTTRVPIIVLIEGDLPEVQQVVKELIEAVSWDLDVTNVFCVVLHCQRNADVDPSEMQGRHQCSYSMTQKLDTKEREWFAKKYVELEQQKQDDEELNPDKLLGFMLMKEEFNRDYLTRIVSEILMALENENHKEEEFCLMKYTALLTHFDCGAIPVACCDEIKSHRKRQKRAPVESYGVYSRTHRGKLLWEKAMSATARMLLIEKCLPEIRYTNGIVLAHKCLATEILRQLEEDGHTLYEITRGFLSSELMRSRSHGKQYLDLMVKQLLIRRKKVEYGDKENTRFSELILAIEKTDEANGNDALKILDQGFETLKDPMVAQHAARLCYIRERYRDYGKALEYIEKALNLAKRNSYLWDTKGQIFKSQMFTTVSDLKTNVQHQPLSANKEREIILLAHKAMDTFHQSQVIALSETHENNAGFFNEVSVALTLLQFMQNYIRPFNNEKNGANQLKAYLLDDQIPLLLKNESWYEIHNYMSKLKERVYAALSHIDDYLVLTRGDKPQQQQDIKKRDEFYESYKEWFGDYRPLEVQSPLDKNEARRRKVISMGAQTFHQVFDHLRADKRKLGERFQNLRDVKGLLEKNDPKNRFDLFILICVTLALSSVHGEHLPEVETVHTMVKDLFEKSRENDLYSAFFMLMFEWAYSETTRRPFQQKSSIPDRVFELKGRWENRFQNTRPHTSRSHQYSKQTYFPYKKKPSTYFFLAQGKGLQRLLHISELSKFDRDMDRDAFWKKSTLEKRLQVLEGTLYSRNSLNYSPGVGKKIHIRLSRPMSSPVSQEAVTFYLGFSFEGPVAYNVQISGMESPEKKPMSYDMPYPTISNTSRQQTNSGPSESSQQLYMQMRKVKRELEETENNLSKRHNRGQRRVNRKELEKKKLDLEKKYEDLDERYKKAIHADID